jgi:valyl-tRNA synthetase
VDVARLPVEDRWILAELDETVAATTADLDAFRFSEATRRLREFAWGEFCDWYVEFIKTRLRDPETRPDAQRVAAAVLDVLCRLLHPIMPFLTEQIWQPLGELAQRRGAPEPSAAAASVCIAPWPVPAGLEDAEARATVAQWKEKIQAIRNLRAERNVPKDAKIAPLIVAEGVVADRLRLGEAFIRSLTGAANVEITADGSRRPADSAVAVLADAEIVLPLEGLIDKEAELAKLRKSLADLDRQIAPLRAKLANQSFTSRAPAEVVAASREKLAELEAQYASVAGLVEAARS